MRSTSLLVFASILAIAPWSTAAADGPKKGQIKNLVTFGDSYTDVGGPAGSSNNGTQWPVYVADYAHVSLFPFARSGAACSDQLTPKAGPYLMQNELPEYFSATGNGSIKVKPDETIYTLWIGTNDLGVNAILNNEVKNNATIVDVTKCAVGWVNTLYKSGARNFLYQNIIPLQRTPLYQVDSYLSRYWSAPRNSTAWNLMIDQLAVGGNAIAELMLQALPASLPDAHIGLFDSHSLFNDILDHPSKYLNGSAPLNVTGSAHGCRFDVYESTSGVDGNCTDAEGTAVDSFAWYDEIHPSEQSDRVVAREIANVISGKGSKWATWYS
ncbi:hypothetical protein EWM64_g10252 [Hericium alpestre]|uniref:Carbohydrate esterase family 16 protein n=1 Tax=Hericium alpestre TaxID=135208 RepID=A0A4Y9ZHU8_9AGAM|nr:hypothetical protein EWM64_g10252 [Hericium alpestre]